MFVFCCAVRVFVCNHVALGVQRNVVCACARLCVVVLREMLWRWLLGCRCVLYGIMSCVCCGCVVCVYGYCCVVWVCFL